MRRLLLAALLSGSAVAPTEAATLITYELSGFADILEGSVLKFRQIDVSLTITKQSPFCGSFAQYCEADQRLIFAESNDPADTFNINIAFLNHAGGAPNTDVSRFLDAYAVFKPSALLYIGAGEIILKRVTLEAVAGDGLDRTGYSYILGDYLPVRPLPPVPEPGSWAMMISGLALVGAAIRRRTTIAYA
jgi:hypothetical protein